MGVSGGAFGKQFFEVTNKVINSGGRIKFDLSDVSVTGAKSSRTSAFSFSEAAKRGRATEWELNRILGDQRLKGSTDFYLNGVKQSAE